MRFRSGRAELGTAQSVPKAMSRPRKGKAEARIVWIHGPDLETGRRIARLLFLEHHVFEQSRIAQYAGQPCILFHNIDGSTRGRTRLNVQRLVRWESLACTAKATFVVVSRMPPENTLVSASLVDSRLPKTLSVDSIKLALSAMLSRKAQERECCCRACSKKRGEGDELKSYAQRLCLESSIPEDRLEALERFASNRVRVSDRFCLYSIPKPKRAKRLIRMSGRAASRDGL